MKIIFLDIDGVLNSQEYFINNHNNIKEFYKDNIYNKDNVDLLVERQIMDIDYDKLLLLKKIIDATQSKVVITSTWKQFFFFQKIVEKFIEFGIPVVGATEDSVIDRGAGIKKYIQEHDVSSYAILDDEIFDDYDDEIMNRLVKTNFYGDGLSDEEGKKLIKLLKK